MSSNGEEEETGPSVDSNDQEERIAARRLRIQKRLESQKRAQMGEDPSEKREVKEEVSKSRAQMEESRLRLTKLRADGSDLVSNIRVASDAREAARRVEEEENRRHRKERLEAEARVGTEKFEEITRKWETSLQKEIPQDLHVMLSQQKQSCDAMIEEKNKLITDFQMELKQ
jgi:dynein regulatory complex protein 1